MPDKRADEQPPVHPDAALMQGGPGVETPPAADDRQPEPQGRELKIAGRTFKVEPELYEAIEGYRREINERDGRRGSEMQALRDQLKRLEDAVTARSKTDEPAPPKGPQLPAPELQFTDPARYQRELIDYVEARVAAERNALQEQYQKDVDKRTAEQKERDELAEKRKVWDDHVNRFYQDNPDLVGEESLVEVVRRDNVNELKDLPLADGFKKLATLTRERMIRYAGKVREKGDEAAPPRLEGAARPRDAGGRFTPPADKGGGTLSALIRAKQAKRAAA